MARLNRKMRKQRARVGDEGVISPFPEKPKGMRSDTYYRLELKDIQANREKTRILSAQISCLEAEFGSLHTDPADDVLEGN